MRILRNEGTLLKNSKGATAVIVAIVIAVLLGFAAFAVDIGYILGVKNELQNIADASALAAARTLGRLYECNGNIESCPGPMSYSDQLTYSANEGAIKNAAKEVALSNKAGGKSGIVINDEDIVIGNWNSTTKTMTPTLTSPDAVSVVARRDASANGPITTFLAGVIGIDLVDVTADATAALTGLSEMEPGRLPLPVAINSNWAVPPKCNESLTFHPSSEDTCSAWHAYDGEDYSANQGKNGIGTLIEAIENGTYTSPETIAGETEYVFTNGTLSSVFTSSAIQDLFDTMKVKNDGVLDFDEDSTTWTTSVAVYDGAEGGCEPNKAITIVGFSTVKITSVSGPPESTIYAEVKCDNVEPGRGSGSETGTKGSIPTLVE